MASLREVHEWKQTRKGLVISGVVEAVLAYVFASWAIDSGNWLVYLVTFVLIIGALQSLIKAVLRNR